MPLKLNVLKKLDEADCYVSSQTIKTQKTIKYLQDNQETAYTITDLVRLLTEQQNKLNIPDVNQVKFNKSTIYSTLLGLSKEKLSPIKKKGSYFWFDKKDSGK